MLIGVIGGFIFFIPYIKVLDIFCYLRYIYTWSNKEEYMAKSLKRVLCLILFFLFLSNFLYARGNNDEEAPVDVETDVKTTEKELPEEPEQEIPDPDTETPVVEEEPEPEENFIVNGREKRNTKFNINFNLGLGVETFNEVTYQKIVVSPEFVINKFGIGFDLYFHLTYKNGAVQFREEDWVPDTVTFPNVLELYLPKFAYIRYGHEGDPLYARFGSIAGGKLGNGFIMNGYIDSGMAISNSLFRLCE